MVEILLKVGSNVDPKGYQDGDVIEIVTSEQSKKIWDEMLSRKKCTQAQYDAAQIAPGVFKFPWQDGDKKNHLVIVSDDDMTKEQIAEIMATTYVDPSAGTPVERKAREDAFNAKPIEYFAHPVTGKQTKKLFEPNFGRLLFPTKRRHKIDIETVVYKDKKDGGKIKTLSKTEKDDVRDKAVVVEPDHNKTISISEIKVKA